MITLLSHQLSDIQSRYVNKWGAHKLPSHMPPFGQTNLLFDRLCDELAQRIAKCMESKAAAHDNLAWLLQIFGLKRRCVIDRWPDRPTGTPLAVQWSLHDLMGYARFLNMLHHAMVWTDGVLAASDKPSLTSLELHMDCRRADWGQWSTMLGEHAQWVERAMTVKCTNPYRVELDKLAELHRQGGVDAEGQDLLGVLVDCLRDFEPAHLMDEEAITGAMKWVAKQLRRLNSATGVPVNASATLKLVLARPQLPVEVLNETVETYLMCMRRREEAADLLPEIEFWNHANFVHVAPTACDHVAYIIGQLQKMGGQVGRPVLPPECRIKWGGTVREFVTLFHPLIARSMLTLKGHNDMVPMVTALYRIFVIDKSRGSGVVSCDSLISYFKKANAGE